MCWMNNVSDITYTLEIPSNEKLGHQSVLCNEREREHGVRSTAKLVCAPVCAIVIDHAQSVR